MVWRCEGDTQFDDPRLPRIGSQWKPSHQPRQSWRCNAYPSLRCWLFHDEPKALQSPVTSQGKEREGRLQGQRRLTGLRETYHRIESIGWIDRQPQWGFRGSFCWTWIMQGEFNGGGEWRMVWERGGLVHYIRELAPDAELESFWRKLSRPKREIITKMYINVNWL